MASLESQHTHVSSREYAVSLDAQDPLRNIRNEFIIPTKTQLKSKALFTAEPRDLESHDPCIYLCGNSLGLQPKVTSKSIQQYLTTWATNGVFGHFKPLNGSPLPTWLHADAKAAECIAPIVGSLPSEVAVMQTLTANLHFLLSAFYKPDIKGRHKIILEAKAFPSDHYAVESQITHHNLSPSTSMITIEPPSPSDPTISTSHIISLITKHASTTSILLLPGIQFYTGQLLDIPTITRVARAAGIFVIWDLAHAVGNVPLKLHEWDVDAAVWCTYKYLNAGPGSIGGFFIHERNSRVSSPTHTNPHGTPTATQQLTFPSRLSGWWGSSKESRFAMDNKFIPIPGAAGFQLSNPSIFDITSLNASLEVFALAGGMQPLRQKSIQLTAYLETLLLNTSIFENKLFKIITPSVKEERGAQLSLRLEEGLLDVVMRELEVRGVVVDERRPDVIRVAPTPLYNSFTDVWDFVESFAEAVDVAESARRGEVDAEGTRELEMTT